MRVRYREKARELYEAADSATSDELRYQFTMLARQYEHLAATLESLSDRRLPLPA
jgi:hypothetical protein